MPMLHVRAFRPFKSLRMFSSHRSVMGFASSTHGDRQTAGKEIPGPKQVALGGGNPVAPYSPLIFGWFGCYSPRLLASDVADYPYMSDDCEQAQCFSAIAASLPGARDPRSKLNRVKVVDHVFLIFVGPEIRPFLPIRDMLPSRRR